MLDTHIFINNGYVVENDRNCFYISGVSAGYPFTVTARKKGEKYVLAYNAFFGRALSRDEFKALTVASRQMQLRAQSQNMLSVVLSCNSAVNETEVYGAVASIVQFATGFFNANRIPPRGACFVCGKGGCDCTAASPNRVYSYAHLSCMQNSFSSQVKSANAMNKGNVFLGVLGAVLGTFVGIIPSILTTLLLQRIFAILYLLIPICGYFGYKLLHGKINKATPWIIAVFSILSGFNMEVLCLYFVILREGGHFSLIEVFILYVLNLFGGNFTILKDLLFTLLFTVIGIIGVWKVISATPETFVSDAISTRRSIRMLDGSVPNLPNTPSPQAAAPQYSQPAAQPVYTAPQQQPVPTQQPVQPAAQTPQSPYTAPVQPAAPENGGGTYSTLPENMQD